MRRPERAARRRRRVRRACRGHSRRVDARARPRSSPRRHGRRVRVRAPARTDRSAKARPFLDGRLRRAAARRRRTLRDNPLRRSQGSQTVGRNELARARIDAPRVAARPTRRIPAARRRAADWGEAPRRRRRPVEDVVQETARAIPEALRSPARVRRELVAVARAHRRVRRAWQRSPLASRARSTTAPRPRRACRCAA